LTADLPDQNSADASLAPAKRRPWPLRLAWWVVRKAVWLALGLAMIVWLVEAAGFLTELWIDLAHRAFPWLAG